jgi:hypothetical protein
MFWLDWEAALRVRIKKRLHDASRNAIVAGFELSLSLSLFKGLTLIKLKKKNTQSCIKRVSRNTDDLFTRCCCRRCRRCHLPYRHRHC